MADEIYASVSMKLKNRNLNISKSTGIVDFNQVTVGVTSGVQFFTSTAASAINIGDIVANKWALFTNLDPYLSINIGAYAAATLQTITTLGPGQAALFPLNSTYPVYAQAIGSGSGSVALDVLILET